ALDRAEDLGGHLVAREVGGLADDLVAVHDEHRRERDGRADLTGQPVDGQDVVDGDLLLPAACADNRVHRGNPSSARASGINRSHAWLTSPRSGAYPRHRAEGGTPETTSGALCLIPPDR